MTSVNAELFHREHGDDHCEGCGARKEACQCDPTPWCNGCGAKRQPDCECPPLARND